MSGLEVLREVVTIAALVIGGAWAVWNFNFRRERAPKVELEHAFYSRRLGDGRRLVTVTLTVHNRGSVILRARDGFVGLLKVFPLELAEDMAATLAAGRTPFHPGETVIPWRQFERRMFGVGEVAIEIEPGESDCIPCDFVIPDDAETIRAYTFIPNPAKPGTRLGWTLTTMHDFPLDYGGARMHSNQIGPGETIERQQQPGRTPEQVKPPDPPPPPPPEKKA